MKQILDGILGGIPKECSGGISKRISLVFSRGMPGEMSSNSLNITEKMLEKISEEILTGVSERIS